MVFMLDSEKEGQSKRWGQGLFLAKNLFIVFFLYSALFQTMPKGPGRAALFLPVKPLVETCGLWQNFKTFGPQPPKVNQYLSADVLFDDGSTCVWHYPNLESFDSPLQWLRSLRYRIFWTHRLHKEEKFYPDFARYVAAQCTTNSKHPIAIKLLRKTVYTTFLDPVDGRVLPVAAPREDALYQLDLRPQVTK
jgi:hypothetical protein